MSLTCTRCDNHCLAPPSARRHYACPRCGELLPRPVEPERRGAFPSGAWANRRRWLRAAMLLILIGALTAAVRAGFTSYRAAASARDDDAPRPLIVRLNSP